MKTYGNTITRELVSFWNWADKANCFASWYQLKDQEISEYYNNEEITLEGVINFLKDHADMTCGHGCNSPLLPVGDTQIFDVERIRYWDGQGSTSDSFVLGEVTIKRTEDDFDVNFKLVNKPRR